jgi:hypothetical protein
MRDRMNVYFPPELLKQISDLADRKKLSRSAIVEAAVASFLSPDGGDRREAAFTRRLDRLSRQMQRLERDVGLTAETLALFIRFWLTITPPLPNDAQAAAQTAPIQPSTCSRERPPTIAPVTPGQASVHATATADTLAPWRCAIGRKASRKAKLRLRFGSLKSGERRRQSSSANFATFSRLNVSVNRPDCIGL